MTRATRATAEGRAYLDLQRQARRDARPFDELLTLYTLEGFLVRLAASQHVNNLVLKGGLLLAAYDARRSTRDADFAARRVTNDVEEITRLVKEIAAITADDGLAFDIISAWGEVIRDEDAYSGVRVRVDCRLASAKTYLNVDINVGDPISPAPKPIHVPRLLDEDETIDLFGYPLPMIHAEKIVTALQRQREHTVARLRRHPARRQTSRVVRGRAGAGLRLRRPGDRRSHSGRGLASRRSWLAAGRRTWLNAERAARVDTFPGVDGGQLTAEQRARVLIDRQLADAGWSAQNRSELNLFAAQGVAVREVIMAAGHGRADYLLYVDQRAVGAIEAKPEGTTLSGVEWQSAMYADGLPPVVRLKALTRDGRLPFVFEASGSETHFTNGFDPSPRARRIFNVPRPETLARIVRDADADPEDPTWRAKARHLPPVITEGLRPAQIDAIRGIERTLAEQRFARSLVQMATGAGKTYTAVTESYRLLKHAGFRRVLFLVDRNNLGDQTLREFQNYATPDDGRRFTELYNVDKLTGAGMVGSSHVVISTIQRVYAALRGEQVADADDPNLDSYTPDRPVEVGYNAQMPPEAFDLVIVDEAHRSIYGVWRGVLEYFDAHVVGLTATPVKQTFGFFRQNLVSEYTYAQSVADNVNVDFDVYRIKTQITEQGSTVDAGTIVPVRDKRTRRERYETLDDDLTYSATQLDRAVTTPSQIRLVLETFRDRLFTEIFPRRSTVPKTLIFCKDDNHAEEVVKLAREVFGKGNDFAAKITYSARDPKQLLQQFRTSPTLRIAVTVDMIATGTDIKPLECVFFLRDVQSASYFEQMKGRGARTISPTDFQAVTPDAETKTRFVLVDAIGVTEHEYVDAAPLERARSVSLQKLLDGAAALTLTEDEAATLASRLAKLELQLTPAERDELDEVAGEPLKDVVRRLVAAVDPDEQARAVAAAPDKDPAAVRHQLVDEAVRPVAANPTLRARILELRASHDQVIDEVSLDVLLDAHGVVDTERARSVVESWRQYLDEHRDEITALHVLYEQPQPTRISFAELRDLADRIKRPPYNWTPDLIWSAYEAIEVDRVRHADRHTVTDLVSLVRFTFGEDDELVPYADKVRERYAAWLAQQEQAGVQFGDRERWWLDRIAEVIATSAGVSTDDLDNAPFAERGGVDGAIRDLGSEAGTYLELLNSELTA